MKETDAALAGLLRKNLRGPFWSSFTASWLILNAGFVWALLFQSEQYLYEVYNSTKIDYLESNYHLSLHDDPWLFLLTKIIGPFLLALLLVWGLPHITNEFLAEHEKVKTKEKELREKGSRDRIKEEIRTESERQKLKKIKQSGKDVDSNIAEWRKEYELAKHQSQRQNSRSLRSLEWMLTRWRRESEDFFYVDQKATSSATIQELVSRGLLQMSIDRHRTYVISAKGRWFMDWLDEDMQDKTNAL